MTLTLPSKRQFQGRNLLTFPGGNLLKGLMLLGAIFSVDTAKAQLTGIKTIPGDYATVAAAVTALNTSGVGPGGVTFELASGTTFTETVPIITATGTATDSIVFKRSAVPGTNPKIIPVTAGTVSSSTTIGGNGDAIITINGGDYIVFDGIDLETNAAFTTSAARMEYGYMLKKASATNACKNVTIRNCTITLNRAAIYSFGIFVSNFSGTTSITPTSTGGRTENVKIFGNTINNAYGGIQLRGYAHTSSPYNYLDQNISVGVEAPNTINNFGGGSSTAYGIYTIYQNDVTIANNIINNTANGGAVTTTTLYGIFLTTAANANATVHNNTITIAAGGTTSTSYGINSTTGASGSNNLISIYNNSITGCTFATATSGGFQAIVQGATAYKSYIYNNTITNNTLSATTSGAFYGVFQSGAVVNESKIYGNIITNNTKLGTGALFCVNSSPGSACTSYIYDNVITGNNSNNGINHGIYTDIGGMTHVYRHYIHNQTASGATGSVNGITIASGTATNIIYNNFIAHLTAPIASATAEAIRGINITSTTANSTVNLFHNTIYLNATSTGVNFGTAGIYHTSNGSPLNASLVMMNNNIVNTSVPNGTGYTSAYRRSDASMYNYAASSNTNNFYAGTPSATNVIYYDGLNSDQTMVAYKTRAQGRDAQSVTEMPAFVNISSLPYDLHIAGATPTRLESGGTTISLPVAITEDYDTNPRGSSPDIGADEFSGIGIDEVSPVITYTAPGVACTYADRTITATISDMSGVPVAGAQRPRIYYNKNGGAWTSEPGILVSGTTNSGTWDFTIVGANVGGVSFGDRINYYIVAQDNATTSNLGSIPYGAAGSDVNNISNIPPTTGVYYTGGTMSGSYTIDAASPSSASNFKGFAAPGMILGCGITGPVTINVVSASGPYNDQLIIPVIPGSSASNSVIFQGNGNTISYLSTNPYERAVVKLDGADYVTINNLTIQATGSLASEFGYGVQIMNDADYNTISNCDISVSTSATSSLGYVGIVINTSAVATSVVAAGDSKCDNNAITGNIVTGGYAGISVVANGSTNMIANNIVNNNTVKDFYVYGIYANGNSNLQIKNNDISRPARTVTSFFYGVALSNYNTNTQVNANRIHSPFSGAPTNGSDLYALYNDSYATLGNENIFSNNLVYNLDGTGYQYIMYMVGNYAKYHHNTISSDNTASTTTSEVYGYYLSADYIDIKNNIFTLTRGGTGAKYAAYHSYGIFTANKNLYFLGGTGPNYVGSYNFTNTATLANWQSASGQDATSPSPANPLYASPLTGDFTPTNLTLNNLGTPVGVTADILGVARSITAPDLGAYEFGSYPLDVNVLSFTARKDGRDVMTKWTVGVEDNISTYIVERSADGRGFTEAGEVKSAGVSSYGFNDLEAVTKATGNRLYYRVKTIGTNGKIGYSKIAVVNLDAFDDVFSVYPNPFAASVTIRATAAQSGTCVVVIRDINGKTVATQSSAVEPGTNYIEVSGLGKLARGTYQVIANINGKTEVVTIIK